jgi:hypothetical protein
MLLVSAPYPGLYAKLTSPAESSHQEIICIQSYIRMQAHKHSNTPRGPIARDRRSSKRNTYVCVSSSSSLANRSPSTGHLSIGHAHSLISSSQTFRFGAKNVLPWSSTWAKELIKFLFGWRHSGPILVARHSRNFFQLPQRLVCFKTFSRMFWSSSSSLACIYGRY